MICENEESVHTVMRCVRFLIGRSVKLLFSKLKSLPCLRRHAQLIFSRLANSKKWIFAVTLILQACRISFENNYNIKSHSHFYVIYEKELSA